MALGVSQASLDPPPHRTSICSMAPASFTEAKVTVANLAAATTWRPQTVRGAFSSELKKRLGLTVTPEKIDEPVEPSASLPPVTRTW